jgi:hypothetical protein
MSPIVKLSRIPSIVVVLGLMVVVSCKDSVKPNSKISFAVESEDVTESDGTTSSFHPLLFTGGTGRDIEVKLLLDRPLDQTAVISYTIGGTATKNTSSTIGNFEIKGNSDFITIGPGATEATITITVFENFAFDLDADNNPFKTVILTLESVVSGPVELTPGTQNIYTLTIHEDDTVIYLDWDDGTGSAGDVDMDIVLWQDDPGTPAEDFQALASSSQTGNAFEGISIPAGFTDGKYGMSYTYYSGSSDNVAFSVDVVNFGGTLNGGAPEMNFTGNYTLANLNVYDMDTDANYKGDPAIIQTMVKSGFNYTNLTAITPASGTSRVNTHNIKSFDGKKGDMTWSIQR